MWFKVLLLVIMGGAVLLGIAETFGWRPTFSNRECAQATIACILICIGIWYLV